ncbi:glycosyltransferase family 2 protein [Phyllobacterium sp. UNC302MFCol5.2]|uniref:glycosyltransferase n=1 Tax=Phyllobacterium sp. UNC302MFCol5.2 TaxID=1449065 RepID=UPI000480BB19|nr:glycosyltransferase family 2 protein [Phyllobacterium sp. UNC302MFCol5.2]
MPTSVVQQSILYGNKVESIERSLESIARAALLGRQFGIDEYTVSYGDSSPVPSLSTQQLKSFRERFPALNIGYDFFNTNLGSAGGHNRLAASATADFILIQNPDVIPSPRLLENLVAPFSNPSVGMVEAKQLPIEHPKEYDPVTGDTSWASTACAIVRRDTFERLAGFDSETFFLYCDDVDFSWRVKELGLRVIFQPSAIVFHDKRLTQSGTWKTTPTEQYYSAEAALLLSYKWSREDLTEKILDSFSKSSEPFYAKAAAEFRRRQGENLLPAKRDFNHLIAQFINGNYAQHRYAL